MREVAETRRDAPEDASLVSGASSEPSLNPNKSSGDIGELKPCPFCGGKPRMHIYQTSEDSEGAHVECTACGAQTEATDDAYADTLTAAHIWNTRTPDPESAAEIERLRREVEETRSACAQTSNSYLNRALTAESAVAAAWEEAEKKCDDVAEAWREDSDAAAIRGDFARANVGLNHAHGADECSAAIRSRASAIRAAVSKKTGSESDPTQKESSR